MHYFNKSFRKCYRWVVFLPETSLWWSHTSMIRRLSLFQKILGNLHYYIRTKWTDLNYYSYSMSPSRPISSPWNTIELSKRNAFSCQKWVWPWMIWHRSEEPRCFQVFPYRMRNEGVIAPTASSQTLQSRIIFNNIRSLLPHISESLHFSMSLC